MHANDFSIRLHRLVLFLLICASTTAIASAQTPATAEGSAEAALIPGTTVWITDASGREEQGRIVGLSGGVVTMADGDHLRRLALTEVARVQTRRADSLVNGAAVGAAAAIASGLFLCTREEPWENCRDDVGPIVRIGAIGAGVGIAVDALFRRRVTIYEAPRGSYQVQAAPILTRGARGVRIAVRF